MPAAPSTASTWSIAEAPSGAGHKGWTAARQACPDRTKGEVARRGGFEPPTPRFVVWCSDPAELPAQRQGSRSSAPGRMAAGGWIPSRRRNLSEAPGHGKRFSPIRDSSAAAGRPPCPKMPHRPVKTQRIPWFALLVLVHGIRFGISSVESRGRRSDATTGADLAKPVAARVSRGHPVGAQPSGRGAAMEAGRHPPVPCTGGGRSDDRAIRRPGGPALPGAPVTLRPGDVPAPGAVRGGERPGPGTSTGAADRRATSIGAPDWRATLIGAPDWRVWGALTVRPRGILPAAASDHCEAARYREAAGRQWTQRRWDCA